MKPTSRPTLAGRVGALFAEYPIAAGTLLAIVGAASASAKGIFIKLALAEGVDIETTMAWRMIMAVPVFLAVGIWGYARARRQHATGKAWPITPRSVMIAALLGLLSTYFAAYLDFSALRFISAQLDRLVLLTYPFFVVLIGAAIYRRRLTPLILASLLVSYAGIATIFVHDIGVEGRFVLLGTALALASAISYAIYQIFAKSYIDSMGSGLFNSIAMCAAGPAVIVHFLLTHQPHEIAVPISAMPHLAGVGIFATLIPSYCIAAAIGLIGSERTAVIGNISPVVTIALAILVLGETFTPYHAAGAALVLLGVMLFSRGARVPPPPPG